MIGDIIFGRIPNGGFINASSPNKESFPTSGRQWRKRSWYHMFWIVQPMTYWNKRHMGPVSLTCFRFQNYLKVFAIPETLF